MVSILIPTMNNLEYLKLCCRSVEENTKYDFEILIWDNGSTDETFEWCDGKYFCGRSSDNIGFSRPYNMLASAAKGETIFFADNDFYFLPGWDRVVEESQRKNCWRMPLQLSPAERSGRCVHAMFGKSIEKFREAELKEKYLSYTDSNIRNGTFFPAAMPRNDFFEIGGFNNDFFTSEVAFLWMAYEFYQKRGQKQLTVPDSFVYHFRGMTPRTKGRREKTKKIHEYYDKLFGIAEEDRDRIMKHFEIVGPSHNENGGIIDYDLGEGNQLGSEGECKHCCNP
tara:strand:- start:5146 stop:5991 length:846 start_codon:yes stop_codon:yes gene_type:complete